MKYWFALLWLLAPIASSAQSTDFDTVRLLILIDTVRQKDYFDAHDANGQSFTYLNQRMIEDRYFGQEPSYLLATTPGISVVSDAGSFSGYSYFRMRGIDQTRISMTWDGVPLNEPEDQGVYFSNFPDIFNSVQKVEIHRGVGVGNMGVASYGGSVHLSAPSAYGNEYVRVGGNYGSYGTWRTYEEVNRPLKNHKSLYVRGTLQHSNGYKERSANTSASGLISTQWIKDNHSVKFNGFAGQQANQMAWLGVPLDTLIQQPTYNANSNEDDLFRQLHGQIHYKYDFGRGWFNAIAFSNILDGNYDFDYNNFLGLPSTKEMYNYAFYSKWVGGIGSVHYAAYPLTGTAGISLGKYSRTHTGSEAALGELYQNTGIKQEASAFAKTNWKFGKLSAELDGQIRYAQLSYEGLVPWEGEKWLLPSFRGALSYQLADYFHVYYSLGGSTREPARLDLFYGSDDLLADSLGNPILNDIDIEKCLDHEAGLRLRRKKFAVNANAYWMHFRNEIALNGQFGPSGLPLHSNVAQTDRMGLELEATLQLPQGFRLVHASSISRNQTKEGSETFEPILTPSAILNQQVVWAKERFEFSLNGRYQSRAWLDFANSAPLPAFLTVDAGVQYKTAKMRLGLRGMNLANAQYYGGGYMGYGGIPQYFIQAGANFMASAEFNL